MHPTITVYNLTFFDNIFTKLIDENAYKCYIESVTAYIPIYVVFAAFLITCYVAL